MKKYWKTYLTSIFCASLMFSACSENRDAREKSPEMKLFSVSYGGAKVNCISVSFREGNYHISENENAFAVSDFVNFLKQRIVENEVIEGVLIVNPSKTHIDSELHSDLAVLLNDMNVRLFTYSSRNSLDAISDIQSVYEIKPKPKNEDIDKKFYTDKVRKELISDDKPERGHK